jgi:hypothetical protein
MLLGMSRESLLNRLEREWQAFLQSFADLPDSTLLESGAVGWWSIRDVLAHIATWDEEALKNLPLILDNKPLPRYARYGGIDAFNAREQEQKQGLSLEQVRQELAATHERLISFLKGCPESAYVTGSRFLHRLRLDTYSHYQEHASQITRWRGERER